MQNEPIRFRCDGCNKTSDGVLGFEYDKWIDEKRQWYVIHETELTTQYANCKHCGRRNHVWPLYSEDERWERKRGEEEWP